MITRYRRLALAVLALAFQVASIAQTVVTIEPPDMRGTDPMGVRLVSGLPEFNLAPLQIGPLGRRLSHELQFSTFAFPSAGSNSAIFMKVSTGISTCIDSVCPEYDFLGGGYVDVFYKRDDGTYYPKRNGATSIVRNADGSHTYTYGNGDTFRSDPSSPFNRMVKHTAADGLTRTISYAATPRNGTQLERVRSVTRNDGFQLRYTYQRNSPPTTEVEADQWRSVTSVTAVNLAVDYCDPNADTCTYSRTWPKIQYAWSGSPLTNTPWAGAYTELNVTGPNGEKSKFTQTNSLPTRIISVTPPTSATDTHIYTYEDYWMCNDIGCNSIRQRLLKQLKVGSSTWTYGYTWAYSNATSDPDAIVNNFWETVGSGPQNYSSRAYYNTAQNGNFIETFSTNASSARLTPDFSNRLIEFTDAATGKFYTYVYDSRGNVKEQRQVAVAGSGLSDIVVTAGFDTTCVHPVKCNKPNWVKDGRAQQTDYTYSTTHGGLLTETMPATPSGVRPQKRYSYVQRYAWVKNASGSYVKASSPVWLLASESQCRVGAAAQSGSGCALGSADEVVTSYEYGPDAGPNNLLLRGKVVTATDDGVAVSLRTCYDYDALGNKNSETTPNAKLSSCP